MASSTRHALWLLLTVTSLTLGFATAAAIALPAPAVAPPITAPAPASPLAPLSPQERTDDAPRPRATGVPPQVTHTAIAITRPRPAPRPKPKAVARSRHAAPVSFELEVRRQVARIPLYQPGLARWVVKPGLRNYGLTNRQTSTVYLSPRIPRRLLYSVIVHEWGHVISTHAYGSIRASNEAFMRWFGGSAAIANERAADCIARLLGARWTHYTACANDHWHLGARYLAVGWQLPSQD